MNYIYDIVLNFNKDYFYFYEWNKKDSIINIKKIPLFIVSNNTFNKMKYDNVVVSSDFINLIKDKTFTYSKNKIGNGTLLSNGKEVIGVLFDDMGNLIKRSSLPIDEEEEVLEEINAQNKQNYILSQRDKTLVCLTENFDGKFVYGHTENYIKVYLPDGTPQNQFVKVTNLRPFLDGATAKILKS